LAVTLEIYTNRRAWPRLRAPHERRSVWDPVMMESTIWYPAWSAADWVSLYQFGVKGVTDLHGDAEVLRASQLHLRALAWFSDRRLPGLAAAMRARIAGSPAPVPGTGLP